MIVLYNIVLSLYCTLYFTVLYFTLYFSLAFSEILRRVIKKARSQRLLDESAQGLYLKINRVSQNKGQTPHGH